MEKSITHRIFMDLKIKLEAYFLKYENYLFEEGEILKNSEKIVLKFI